MKINKRSTNKELLAHIETLQAILNEQNKNLTKESPVKKTTLTSKYLAPSRLANSKRSSLPIIYLLGWVGFLVNKLPFLKRFAPLLKRVLGKTPFWKILVLFRKGFVLFNALIAMYFLFKITGFDQGSFLGAFAGMGTVYVDIFTNFIKTTFNWIFDLFDMKIIPKVGNDKPTFPFSPSSGPGWFTKPAVDNNFLEIAEKAKNWYQSPIINDDTPWYRDWNWSSLFYVVGGIVAVSAVIGVSYLAYNYYSTVWYGTPFEGKGKGPEIINTSPGGSTSFATPGNNAPSEGSVRKIFGVLVGMPSYLNPVKLYHYVVPQYLTPEQQLAYQMDDSKAQTVYPYRAVDQTNPWYTRMRIAILGETIGEEKCRQLEKMNLYNDRFGTYSQTASTVPSPNLTQTPLPESSKASSSHQLTPLNMATPGWKDVSLPKSSTPYPKNFGGGYPTIANALGLNTNTQWEGVKEVANKIISIPNTPAHPPVSLPEATPTTPSVGGAYSGVIEVAKNNFTEVLETEAKVVLQDSPKLPKPKIDILDNEILDSSDEEEGTDNSKI